MADWRTLTTADVLTALNGTELTAIKARLGAADGSAEDQLPDIITHVVAECRGYISAWSANTLAEGETLPTALIHHAVVIVRYRLMTRLGLSVNEARTTEYNDAYAYLRDIAKGLVKLPPGSAADDTERAAPSPSLTARERTWQSSSQDGI